MYALSADGPILHPTFLGLVLIPIALHSLPSQPIVIPQGTEVVIRVINGCDASVNSDMQSLMSSLPGDRIVVCRSRYAVRLLHPIDHNYCAMLCKKLHWYEYPTESNRFWEPAHDPAARPDPEPVMLVVCVYGCVSRSNLEPLATNHEQLLRSHAHRFHVA